MANLAQQMMARDAEKRSRQEMIDKTMCKPGYTWNETLGKCLAAGSGGNVDLSEFMSPVGNSQQSSSPEQAIAQEVSARAMQGNS
jgi:hypothetical protein